MTSLQPPKLACCRLPQFDMAQWDSIRAAFAQASGISMHQAWLPTPDPAFKPAKVRTGWTDTDLAVLAELEDDDIFNRATRLNDHTHVLGDVFEMFIKPEEQQHYFEIHITPGNQKLQLQFSRPAIIREQPKQPLADLLAPFLFDDPVIFSKTLVEHTHSRWSVFALLPFEFIQKSGQVGKGTVWRFSFSRYDYTGSQPKPVISSTSLHQEADFHRTAEYGFLTFT